MIIYLPLVIWVLLSSIANTNSILKNKFISNSLLFLLFILFILAIPFNDFSEGDMPRYITALEVMSKISFPESISYFGWEPLFTFMQWSLAQITIDSNIYIIYIATIYFLIYYFISKHFFYNWQRIFFLFSYISFTFFHNYLFNGTRQGFSMGLILLALGIWNNNQNKGKKLKVTLCLIAAMLFHISAVPVVISLVILMISNISLNKILLIWLFFSVLFLTGLNSSIASIPFIGNSEFLLSYTAVEAIDAFGEVNKSTFFIFSLFVLIISLIFYYKTQLGEREKVVYLNLIKSYLIINILFLAFGFIAYSNRLASFSWIFIPLLIMYPVLHNKINNRYILFIILLIFVVIGFLTSAYSIFMI